MTERIVCPKCGTQGELPEHPDSGQQRVRCAGCELAWAIQRHSDGSGLTYIKLIG